MRVLFVAHSFPRFAGDAAGSFILRLADALAARGTEVHVLAPSAPGLSPRARIGRVDVRRFRYAPGARETLAYTGTMAEQVRAGIAGKVALASLVGAGAVATVGAARTLRPDVVHAHWWFPSGLAGAAANAVLGVPLVTTAHGSDVRLVGGVPGGAALLRAVVRRSAAVTTVSTWLGEQLRRAAPRASPVVAPMPVDVDRFAPAAAPARARLLFVGRLNEQKGLEHLLRALALAPPGAMLDVVGEGPLDAPLRALAHSLGIDARVRWLGARPPEALASLYANAAALVVPSIDEGLGLVAVEAQISAAPVIAFASGGLPDVVADGRTGVLVAPRDTAGLAAAIARVYAEPAWAWELGRAGRATALERFSPDVVAGRYLDIYRAAVASRPR